MSDPTGQEVRGDGKVRCVGWAVTPASILLANYCSHLTSGATLRHVLISKPAGDIIVYFYYGDPGQLSVIWISGSPNVTLICQGIPSIDRLQCCAQSEK